MTDTHQAIAVVAPQQRVHPVVQQAMASNPDPSTLRELLAVQREWEAGEARRAYSAALVALKHDLPSTINKDKTVSFGTTTYQHASLAAVVDAVTPALCEHGFSLTWTPAIVDGDVEVTCKLTHRDGHFEKATLRAPIDSKGSKSPAQGVASTTTLLSRYTALALLGVATRDMVEPQPQEPDDKRIDTQRNVRAVAAIKAAGRSVSDAEDLVGITASCWTVADLERVREWLKGGA